MKFRRDRPEEVCGRVVPGEMTDRYADLGGIICMRIGGHAGECVSMAGDAARADGVCHVCRDPLDNGQPHEIGCAELGRA